MKLDGSHYFAAKKGPNGGKPGSNLRIRTPTENIVDRMKRSVVTTPVSPNLVSLLSPKFKVNNRSTNATATVVRNVDRKLTISPHGSSPKSSNGGFDFANSPTMAKYRRRRSSSDLAAAATTPVSAAGSTTSLGDVDFDELPTDEELEEFVKDVLENEPMYYTTGVDAVITVSTPFGISFFF